MFNVKLFRKKLAEKERLAAAKVTCGEKVNIWTQDYKYDSYVKLMTADRVR